MRTIRVLNLICVLARCAFPQAEGLGNVTELTASGPAGPLADTAGRRLEVKWEGLKPISIRVRIAEPSAGVAPRGTVVLGTGGSGGGGYAGGADGQALVRDVAAMGFRVVDRVWAGGWTTHEGGLRNESRRYATRLTWIRDNLHRGGKFVATGSSGGSAEIGYALTTWRRGDILDLAIPTLGPPVARLDYACVDQPTPEWAAKCSLLMPKGVMECESPQCIPSLGNDVCKQLCAQPTSDELLADSVVHRDAVLNDPKTKVIFLYGAHDCGEPVPIGMTCASSIKRVKDIQFIPKIPHNIASTPEGRAAIRRAIDVGKK